MSVSKMIGMCGAAMLLSTAILVGISSGEDAPATPAETTTPHKGHARLTKPWNELKDLTDEEKTKIIAIHQKELDEVKEIEAKAHADILAVLTDTQKKEVAAIELKEKEATRSHKATTQPSAAAK